jgi:hypothetical protein
MTLQPAKKPAATIGLCVCLALVLSVPANAKSRSHKGRPGAAAMMAPGAAGQWGGNLVRTGPLYNGPDYLGTDPDPNIRFQILRDLTGRYGGGGD